MEEIRLGDIIDDHCSKCRMLTNHSVVSMVSGEVAKVQCRTCYYEHKYRHGKGGTKKAPSKKAALFDEVLSKIRPSASDQSDE